ncbi:diguanylate cyclase (GGDEF) domain-containing protein [Lachnospiraceae bacterium NK3A20]|nr:diguanylate cyclase (GGDEF) domain-containing protein [Lachnospiraceae bacterium NK3A20]
MDGLLYSEIYAFALILISMVLIWNHKASDHSSAGIWFTYCLIAFAVNFACNFLWGFADHGVIFPKVQPYFWSYFFKVAYFITLNIATFIWTIYSETEQGADTFKSKDNIRFLFVPLGFAMFLAVIDPWTHLLFVISPGGRYERMSLYPFQMGLLLLYTSITAFRMLDKARYEVNEQRRIQMRLIGAFPIYLLGAWILSFFLGNLPLFCIAITCAILNIYIGNSTNQISIDKLTQINNRQNLLGYINGVIRSHDLQLYLLMIDVDYFKKVNDNFGHQEGDAALVRVANALKSACGGNSKKRPYIARYGGDEFIVVAEAQNEEEIEGLCRQIHDKLYYFNIWSSVPYNLTVSIGAVRWQEGMDTMALIGAADEKLYEVKAAREPFQIKPRSVPHGINLED